jgi:hypothetical protein
MFRNSKNLLPKMPVGEPPKAIYNSSIICTRKKLTAENASLALNVRTVECTDFGAEFLCQT